MIEIVVSLRDAMRQLFFLGEQQQSGDREKEDHNRFFY